ncbi:MAG TPA: OB-fold nucleic acid binding domain-containing protein [Acidimicrobiia bacterium]|jgi:hypothetical protein
MPLRKLVDRVTKGVEESDREALAAFCDDLDGLVHLDQLPLRVPVRFGGEITSVRIVPRAGAPALEVTISDGRGSVVAVFLGRRKIAAMKPGRRLIAEGVATARGPERLVYNPWYRFIPR